jgi:hypothetical protein
VFCDKASSNQIKFNNIKSKDDAMKSDFNYRTKVKFYYTVYLPSLPYFGNKDGLNKEQEEPY